MKELIFDKDKKLDTFALNRIGDLSYFEGPLLSLFYEIISGHFYVFDWVDRDAQSNRWIIYRISPKHLLQFLRGEVSHFELFRDRPEDMIYFTDIDARNKPFFQYNAFQLKHLPDDYLPNKDNFFDPADCNAFVKIRLILRDSLSNQKSENEYPRNYRVTVLKQNEGRIIYFNRIPRDISAGLYDFLIKGSNFFKEKGDHFDPYIPGAIETLTYASIKKTTSTKREKYANQYH